MATIERTDPDVHDLREQLAHEREQLVDELAALRSGAGIGGALRKRLPMVAAAAFATGFVLAGGIGATARLIMRRGREGRVIARVGRYVVVDRG